ncbi:universal stress protein [Streptomyces cadmiisoli]|uniref:universal stress protein n=1 Tax=Streptomyces cadmiisoli TaxID=2184053 RepID=UPI0036650CAB
MTGPVVVGIDGSSTCTSAAWWAAREAAVRQVPLHLVHSWTTQPHGMPGGMEAEGQRRYGQDVLRQTATELLNRYDGLRLTTEMVAAPAAQDLLDRSRDAELLVLGSRAPGSAAGFLLGSTARHVVGLTRCPAVVVRRDDPTVEVGRGPAGAADRDEIVVGVPEPGPAADAVLEFAFTTADARGDVVRAVTAVRRFPGAPDDGDPRAGLAAALAPWQVKFPGVGVVERVAAGPADQVLLTSCARSRLLVVGRRPHPSHVAWELRPTVHAAVRHAPCPVAVVPHG